MYVVFASILVYKPQSSELLLSESTGAGSGQQKGTEYSDGSKTSAQQRYGIEE